MAVSRWKLLRQAMAYGIGAMLMLGAAAPLTSPAFAEPQKKKKDKSGDLPKIPIPDERAIDIVISEMIGAWQIGDVERLHKAYADDVMVVSGAWEPPVIGWESYLKSYQTQRARILSPLMERYNTYVKVDGNIGWASYQWAFKATVDGNPMEARGQTTLVLGKRSGRWVIVHNHTSLVAGAPAAPAAAPAKPQPIQPESKPPAS